MACIGLPVSIPPVAWGGSNTRWQDVDELLAAGIDVYSTLNVQHLESLNDVVGGITGIVVHETVPDTFFDGANEVVLVDTPADELIARLAAGKVYLPAQAERAARNFFRKGNLMALRRTADRVEDDVQAYRSDRAIGQVWKTEAALLCSIGPGDGRPMRYLWTAAACVGTTLLAFAVSDLQYLLTFVVMLAVGLVTGQMTAGLRYLARVATHRETRSRALFEAACGSSGNRSRRSWAARSTRRRRHSRNAR